MKNKNQINQIKEQNRKALPCFFVTLFICAVIGGLLGFFSLEFKTEDIGILLEMAGDFFAKSIAPWILVAEAVAVPLICIPIYRSAKKQVENWDGENEEVYEKAEYKISLILWLTGMAQILSFIFIAAVYSQMHSALKLGNENFLLKMLCSLAAFIAIVVEYILITQKCVDMTKQLNPEQKASFYDVKFKKKWLEDCDEAQKLMIGKCAIKAWQAMSVTCEVLCVLFVLGSLILGIGILPTLLVCLIWGIGQTVYCLESIRIQKL